MVEEKWDLNSKIYDWFDSVLSDDNILKSDFLTDLSSTATFADVIIAVGEDRAYLSEYLCGLDSTLAPQIGETAFLNKIAELTGESIDTAYCLRNGYFDNHGRDEGVHRMLACAKAAKNAVTEVTVVPVWVRFPDDPDVAVSRLFCEQDTAALDIDERIFYSGYTSEELRGMVGKTVDGDFTIVAVEEPEKMKATYVRPDQKSAAVCNGTSVVTVFHASVASNKKLGWDYTEMKINPTGTCGIYDGNILLDWSDDTPAERRDHEVYFPDAFTTGARILADDWDHKLGYDEVRSNCFLIMEAACEFTYCDDMYGWLCESTGADLSEVESRTFFQNLTLMEPQDIAELGCRPIIPFAGPEECRAAVLAFNQKMIPRRRERGLGDTAVMLEKEQRTYGPGWVDFSGSGAAPAPSAQAQAAKAAAAKKVSGEGGGGKHI